MAMNLIIGIFYFLLLVGILIFIHEGGHFIFAKLFKVRVQVFSLGMGPRLLGFKKGDTDYRISAIPIGGYVRMLGEDPTELVNQKETIASIQSIAPWKRIVIYAAGPAMNLIFPLFLYFFLALGQESLPPAEIGMVIDNTPAKAAGLQPGDKVVAIDGEHIHSFNHMVDIISAKPNQTIKLTISRKGEQLQIPISPEGKIGAKYQIPFLKHLQKEKGLIGIVGIYPNSTVAISKRTPSTPPQLNTFDNIVSVNGTPIKRLIDFHTILLDNKGKTVTISYKRLKKQLPKKLFPNAKEAATLDITKQPSLFEKHISKLTYTVPKNYDSLSQIGIDNTFGYILNVEATGPAQSIGLQRGDKLIALNGKKQNPFDILGKLHQLNKDQKDTKTYTLTWQRDGKTYSAKYKANFFPAGTKKDLGLEDDIVELGFHTRPYSEQWFGAAPEPQVNLQPIAYAGHMAVSQTLFWSEVILDVLKSVLTGNISPKAFSGPIGIGHAAAQVGKEGASAFFGFMGFVSLNLGLMNLLLPIPVLDGGRLVLIITEVVMRKKLSQKIQERILVTGAIMIIMLMVWAVIMDIARIYIG